MNTNAHEDDTPQSVEEAGALLGATITKLHLQSSSSPPATQITNPPKGMHSSFACVSPVPASELFQRLHSLRALLRSVPKEQLPLVAAPSVLAVLLKLLRISSSVATALLSNSGSGLSSGSSIRRDGTPMLSTTPPMLSTPLRTLWVDCVVLCNELGQDLTGTARMDTLAFLRTLLNLASTNPKSSKAAGGTRLAALQVIGGMFESSNVKLSSTLAPWALDVLQQCHKGLKSSGQHEPSHRLQAVRTACRVVVACRTLALTKQQQQYGSVGTPLMFAGSNALEEKALIELSKLVRQAATDKFPEVRGAAANLTSLVAPMLVLFQPQSSMSDGNASSSVATSPTLILDDIATVALRNVDDELAGVATQWAEAAARCIAASVQYGEQLRASGSTRSAPQDEGNGPTSSADTPPVSRFGGGRSKSFTISQQCSTWLGSVQFLVDRFVKAGGELAASRCGGTFSAGGRAVRVGVSLALMKLLQLQARAGSVGNDLSTEELIGAVLNMVGPELEKQIKSAPGSIGLDARGAPPSPSEGRAGALFGSGRNKSRADAGLARLATNRVLRQGLLEVSPEGVQLAVLRELIASCQSEVDIAVGGSEQNGSKPQLTGHQLQVVLIEISHLVTTLGEAAASCREDIISVLQSTLSHPMHGVRHEAAVACAAVAGPFSSAARKLLRSSVDQVQLHHAELVKLAISGDEADASISPGRRRRFRKTHNKQAQHPSLADQCAIHGHCLVISTLLRELPNLPGGLPTDLLMSGLSVAEILVNCQYNDVLAKADPVATCTCVRAGYGIVCGALTVGAESVTPHVQLVFGLWEKIGTTAKSKKEHFSTENEVICFDAAVSSVVAFLNHCPELLLAVPEALSKTTLLLEQLLPLVLQNGRLVEAQSGPPASSSLDALKASLMEAFAWLPPGSFPMEANYVFAMSAQVIRSSTEAEVTCSLLPSLVNNEDEILDAKSLERAERYGQVGGAREIDETQIAILAEIAHHVERESVLHFQTSKIDRTKWADRKELRGSEILAMIAFDGDQPPAPTPLHEVGTWCAPVPPSPCSKVRLVDAAVQSFSATFGLKDGKEQQAAMLMLESLVPPLLAQLARAIGVNAALAEPERRQKAKDDHAAVANITAVLLACLQALPLHEATHDIPIGLGPPWMNKAKDLLLTLLPSASNIVRRAAAEGLALLATLGVTEDAHTLQSAVLHSLDEVMQGNQPDGKPRAIPLAPVSAARAGSLLTLACIQRTAYRIKQERRARARGRAKSNSTGADSGALPTVQMMTRLLPSLTCPGLGREAFVVRTYALHSFGLLIAYSQPQGTALRAEDEHLLRKAVEVVEENFLAAWTSISADFDRGQEAEKLAAEASFLAVLLRLMTFLVPTLETISAHPGVAHRFSCMATLTLETCGCHPVVFAESMAFFDRLASFQHVLPPSLTFLSPTENSLTSCMPFVARGLLPDRPPLWATTAWSDCTGCRGSIIGMRTATRCAKLLSIALIVSSSEKEIDMASILMGLLEHIAGRRTFSGETVYRPLAAPRGADVTNNSLASIEVEAIEALDMLLLAESRTENKGDAMLQWILRAKLLLSGVVDSTDDPATDESPRLSLSTVRHQAINRAYASASSVLGGTGQCRWQVKCQATRSSIMAIRALRVQASREGISLKESPQFNPEVASKSVLQPSQLQGDGLGCSFLSLHLAEVLASACSAAVATLDQAELLRVQEGGARFLSNIVSCFGDIPDPDEADVCILDQYSSQILSSVKHSLSLDDLDDDQEVSGQLFFVGCGVLQAVVQSRIITDPLSLKRLVRPVLPSEMEFPYCPYSSDDLRASLRNTSYESSSSRNQREVLFPHIGKLWAMGKLRDFADNGIVPAEVISMIMEVIDVNNAGLAVHSAAIAMDGCRLLLGNGLTLCGKRDQASHEDNISCSSGLLYANVQDVDENVKATIVTAWPTSAYQAVVNFVEALRSEDDEARRAELREWLTHLVPVLFAGFYSGVDTMVTTVLAPTTTTATWSRETSAEEVTIMCMRGLRVLVREAPKDLIAQSADNLAAVVKSVLDSIILPLLNNAAVASSRLDEEVHGPNTVSNAELVVETCNFLESLSLSPLETEVLRSAVMLAVLSPLNALQNDQVDVSSTHALSITSSCLVSSRHLIQRPDAEESLVQAMMQLCLDVLSNNDSLLAQDSPPGEHRILTEAKALLGECLNHDEIPTLHREGLAHEMALGNKWDAWAIICSHSCAALAKSIPVACETLQDPELQTVVLSAIRHVVQDSPVPTIQLAMRGLGVPVLSILQSYGTLTPPPPPQNVPNRTAVCANAMKILMLAYPTLSDDNNDNNDDDHLTKFLTIVLELWTLLIGYNGLPNQASPQPHADPELGRMAAQAIVVVARTAPPAAFKRSMPHLSERGRALLEFAVRAEMSGYSGTTTTAGSSGGTHTPPTKKKLNLQGFKKQ